MDRNMNGTNSARSMWRVILWGALALVLALPALAMQFTSDVDWSPADFGIMALLLGALGLAIEAAMRLLHSWPSRLAAGGAALLVFLVIWAELAVGILGTPFAGS